MRNSFLKATLIILLLFSMVICVALYGKYQATTPDIHIPQMFTYVDYTSELKGDDQLIEAGQKVYNNLIQWLRNNPSGWNLDFNTYSPNRYFYSDDLRINILDEIIVLNYKLKYFPWFIHVSKKIDSAETVLGATEE